MFNNPDQINTIKFFLWWLHAFYEFSDEMKNGKFLFEGPIDNKYYPEYSPYNLEQPPVYKKRNTEEEVLNVFQMIKYE